MTTFSQLVDELAVSELKRPDMRVSIASWLNQAVRDVHSKSSSRAAVEFGENRVELETTFATLPAVWPIPIPARFQKLEAAYAPQRGVYLKDQNPKIVYANSDNPMDRFYYYRSGSTFVFNGIDIDETLRLTYFQFPPMLQYYTPATRPAVWDAEAQEFVVDAGWAGTDQEALDAVTHWLLIRHPEALKEGVRPKVYHRLDNEVQSKTAWSAFEAMREAIHHLEGV